MTANNGFDRFDRDLRSWLEAEAPTGAPVGFHDAVIERAGRSRQRPRWLVAVRRSPTRGSFGTLDRPGVRVAYLLILLALALAIVVAAIAGGAFRSDPRKLGRNGAIAYSVEDHSQRNQRYHSYLIDADGTDDRPIYPASCPTFSTNGTVLAFVSDSSGKAELYVAASDGSSPRVVPGIADRWDSGYALSPDGTRIAWFKELPRIDAPSQAELWVSPVSGGRGIRIVPAPADRNETFSSPVWSPDGGQIAFARHAWVINADTSGTYRSGISIVDEDGSNLRSLTARPGTDHAMGISWSPDGQMIVYDGLPDGSPLPSLGVGSDPTASWTPPLDIFVIDADGTDDRNLTNSTTDEFQPAWSPDGAHLAYQTDQDGGNLVIVRMDGPTAVGSPILGPASDRFAWSPDGTELLLLNVVWRNPSVGSQQVRSTIRSMDAEFRVLPTTLLEVDDLIPCAPSWQRLEP